MQQSFAIIPAKAGIHRKSSLPSFLRKQESMDRKKRGLQHLQISHPYGHGSICATLHTGPLRSQG